MTDSTSTSTSAKTDYARPASGGATRRVFRPRSLFRPRLLPTLAAIAVIPLFIALGQWQWHKATVKSDLQAELDSRSAQPAVQLTGATVDAATLRYRQVKVRGIYEPARQILVDNRVHREQAGYHVLTPLHIEGSEARVLVNRGWIPAGADHSQVPAVATPNGSVELSGIAIVPGTRFFTLAAETPTSGWSPVWQNLDLARYRAAAGFPLLPVVIQLDPDSTAAGFVREWPRPAERLEQHLSYALQWWGFALATVAIWLFVNWRRA